MVKRDFNSNVLYVYISKMNGTASLIIHWIKRKQETSCKLGESLSVGIASILTLTATKLLRTLALGNEIGASLGRFGQLAMTFIVFWLDQVFANSQVYQKTICFPYSSNRYTRSVILSGNRYTLYILFYTYF